MTAMSLNLNLIRQRHDLMVEVGTLELASMPSSSARPRTSAPS